MSGPYDSYNQYNQGYQQGYPPQQNYQQQGGYPPQQSYNQYPQDQNFGPPHRADSFGPPQQGGFQHGQAQYQYGAYDASNPQGHAGYYNYNSPPQPQHQQSYGGGSNDAFAQNQAYQQSMSDPNTQPQYQSPPQTAPQSTDPNAPNYDPNAPPMTESDRGLLGAIGGGWAGHHFGKQQGHGLLGTIAGAIGGSLLEDKVKDRRHNKHGHHGGRHGGGSSWGGSGRY